MANVRTYTPVSARRSDGRAEQCAGRRRPPGSVGLEGHEDAEQGQGRRRRVLPGVRGVHGQRRSQPHQPEREVTSGAEVSGQPPSGQRGHHAARHRDEDDTERAGQGPQSGGGDGEGDAGGLDPPRTGRSRVDQRVEGPGRVEILGPVADIRGHGAVLGHDPGGGQLPSGVGDEARPGVAQEDHAQVDEGQDDTGEHHLLRRASGLDRRRPAHTHHRPLSAGGPAGQGDPRCGEQSLPRLSRLPSALDGDR